MSAQRDLDNSSTGKCPSNESSACAGKPSRIGIMTTWNQECGLATYARFMVSPWEKNSYIIFAEQTDATTRSDEPFVLRCWKKGPFNYSSFQKAVIESGVGLLHINCQPAFFAQPEFAKVLEELKASGIKIVVQVHNLFTFDEKLTALLRCADRVIVHAPENRLEAIANGALAKRVQVIPHGVYESQRLPQAEKDKIREKLSLPKDQAVLVSFGFVQPHKGMEGILEAVLHLKSKGIQSVGIIAGKANADDPGSAHYRKELERLTKENGIAEQVRFLDRFITEDEVTEYLNVADIVLMNYRSQHYEASGACSLAVGAGAKVVTSLAPPFLPFHDAVFHASGGYPVPLACEAILTRPALAQALMEGAERYTRNNSWAEIKNKIFDVYHSLGVIPSVIANQDTRNVGTGSVQMKKIRVLLHNRPTTFSQRGGDTVVIEKLLSKLSGSVAEVTLDLEAKENPADFDLVHIFNFAIPEMVAYYGKRAKEAGKPFVVTTLLEDIPSFHYQSHFLAAQLQEYVGRGQDKSWWQANKPDFSAVQPCEPFENGWSAQNATLLFANGGTESETLKRTYGDFKNISEIKLGYDIGISGDADRFYREFGVKDFVLCVGRIESRKNQLMLLKALEHDDCTVVLAGGGFSYQPEYEASVKRFSRKGKTIILPRLSDQQLADAYAAAKVHALPSWYELPGLVSLEAAYYGCNVVASRRGTSADYLGEDAFYCDPADEDSIRSAILAAFYSPFRTALKEKVMAHSWEETAKKTLDAYKQLSGWSDVTTSQASTTLAAPVAPPVIPSEDKAAGFNDLFEKGELAARDHEFDKALEFFMEAEKLEPHSSTLSRARGCVELARGCTATAKTHFEQALRLDAFDPKSLCGLGMCCQNDGNQEAAYKNFLRALELKADHTIAIYKLLESAYALNRYDGLEGALRRYLQLHPSDLEMKFCLAGCFYKQGNLAEAETLNAAILAVSPQHRGATELARLLKEAAPTVSVPQLSTSVEVVRTKQSKSDLSSFAQDMSPIEKELVELEDLKRRGKYSMVRTGVEAILQKPSLSTNELQTANCLFAEILVLTDSYSQADTIYNEVLTTDPQCARAKCGKGALAAVEGKWDKARELFNEALVERPEYDVALSGLGLCAAQARSYEAAWNYYQRALQSNGENVRALLGVIETGYVLKKLDAVEDALKAYLDLHPADLDFMYSLAGCCFAQGKMGEAIDAINQITLFDPMHKNALELRSMIERSEGATL